MHKRSKALLRNAMAVAALLGVPACGPSPITSSRIERAIAPTFGNLVHLQLARAGLSSVAASAITVRASCRKAAADTGSAGAGDWVCALDWHGPNRKLLRDTYDLSVGTDGCYTATIEGGEATLGGPTITAANGATIRNLLYAFEGCFDPTGDATAAYRGA